MIPLLKIMTIIGSLGLFIGEPCIAAPGPLSKVERIQIEEKGFSIVPPYGWEIVTNQPGVTLFMQIPKNQEQYQRSIQVRYGKTPVVIDKYGADNFAKLLEQNRAAAFGSSANYRIRSSIAIHLADGNPGILYYTEFSYDEIQMMEMHVLISSKTGHFLLTFTDISQNFESNGPGTPLDIAYVSMISAQLESHSGGRFDLAIKVGIAALGLILFWLVFKFSMARKSLSYGDGADVDDDEELDPRSLKEPLSETDKYETDINLIRSKTSIEAEELRAIEEERDFNSDNPETYYDDDDDSGMDFKAS